MKLESLVSEVDNPVLRNPLNNKVLQSSNNFDIKVKLDSDRKKPRLQAALDDSLLIFQESPGTIPKTPFSPKRSQIVPMQEELLSNADTQRGLLSIKEFTGQDIFHIQEDKKEYKL